MILNLGCGQLQKPNALNVDLWDGPGVDMVYDLNRLPWPWETGAFAEVWALDILEHLDDFLGVMREIHRVMTPGGRLHVRTTCWETRQSFTDPTHKRFLTEDTFNFWQPGHWMHEKYPAYHRGCRFQVQSARRDGEELVFEMERLP